MNNPAVAQKIVIVEDEAALAEIYKTRLQLLGYECYVAHEGIEALDLIEKVRPNLVLLDIMLPKLSGDVILRTIRSTVWGKDIRVLIISNLNENDAPAGIREQGIEGYAVKANMTDDMIDKLVDDILKPEGQKEDVNLDNPVPQPETNPNPTPLKTQEPPLAPHPAPPEDPFKTS